MSEELRVDELGRDGSAVDADHRASRASRQRVNHPGDDLLARAGLAFEEDGSLGRRDALDPRDDLPEPGAGADDVTIMEDGSIKLDGRRRHG